MRLVFALAAYVAAVVLANIVTAHYGDVPVGFGLVVTAGTYFAGFALLARDFIHRYAGPGRSRYAVVIAAIAVAGLMSWHLSIPALAVASTVAFVGAELLDMLVFEPARNRLGFVPGVILSNVVSAPVDTILFLTLAGFAMTPGLVAGQVIGKVLWATLVPLLVYVATARVYTRVVAA